MDNLKIISNDILITAQFESEAEKNGYIDGWASALVVLDELITNITEATPYVDGKINCDTLKRAFADVYKSITDALGVKD